jgi:hypothetical protein
MANRPDAIKSSRRIQCSSASIRTTWQYRPDAIQSLTSNRVFVSDTNMGRQLQIVRTMWCSRPDAIHGKASRTTEVQPSGRGLDMEAFSAILERRLQLIVWTLGQAVRTPSSISIITFCSNIGLESFSIPSGRLGITSGGCSLSTSCPDDLATRPDDIH